MALSVHTHAPTASQLLPWGLSLRMHCCILAIRSEGEEVTPHHTAPGQSHTSPGKAQRHPSGCKELRWPPPSQSCPSRCLLIACLPSLTSLTRSWHELCEAPESSSFSQPHCHFHGDTIPRVLGLLCHSTAALHPYKGHPGSAHGSEMLEEHNRTAESFQTKC